MSSPTLTLLHAALAPLGLTILGHCPATPEDGLGEGTLVLIGPDEPAFWPIFHASPEAQDGETDPLDRWSRRVLTKIATNTGGVPYFPFGGEPYRPFYTWALRTGRIWASPIGFLVHETAGLFVSFRGAILLPITAAAQATQSPCDTCTDHPCKTSCPVGAFDDGYDVAACKSHLATPSGADCMTTGCRARQACPVGQGNRRPAQAAFHMKAFL